MPAPTVPPAFALLTGEKNHAADATLVEVLPFLDPPLQVDAVKALGTREHQPSLAKVISRFHQYPSELQDTILGNVQGFFSGIRLAVAAADTEGRLNAIDIIHRCGDSRLVYLLGEALRSRCPRSRDRAAEVLHDLTQQLLDQQGTAKDAEIVRALHKRSDHLTEALRAALSCWEVHHQPKVLRAVLWMADRFETDLAAKLADQRSNLARAIQEQIARTTDPRLAGFVLRALAYPELRPAAARAIAEARDEAFLRALCQESWVLADPRLAALGRWITELSWLEDGIETLLRLPRHEAEAAVRLVAASGVRHGQKMDAYHAVLNGGAAAPISEAVWQLVGDPSQTAQDMLVLAEQRAPRGAAGAASRELQRRRGELGGDDAPVGGLTADTPGVSTQRAPHTSWDTLWQQFSRHDAEQRASERRLPPNAVQAFLPHLREKLQAGHPLQRLRALRIIRFLKCSEACAESIYKLAFDADPVVRSAAVGMLADLPGRTTDSILRRALADVDDRVQANAVEAMDRLETPDRHVLVEPLLHSRSGRVRANAVKTLLRLEFRSAGEALIKMLEDPQASQRLSALWVIEHLRLGSIVRRVEHLRHHDEDDRVRHRAERVLRRLQSQVHEGEAPDDTTRHQAGEGTT